MDVRKVGNVLLRGKNDIQNITVDGTMYYLKREVIDSENKFDFIDLSNLPPLSSIHVIGDLYYTPDCEMTVHGNRYIDNINMVDDVTMMQNALYK